MPPRDPSSVDADDIDLRVPASETDPPEVVVDDVDAEDDGADPDNPFSLSGTSAAHGEAPAPGTIRRRRDVGESRPLGPGPLPGPVTGSLDLSEVHPVGDEVGPGFLPAEPGRRRIRSILVRLIATAGVIGIGTAVGAGLAAGGVAGWVVALVVSTLSVALAALLWRGRRL